MSAPELQELGVLRRHFEVLARASLAFTEAANDHARLLEVIGRELSVATGSGGTVRLLSADGASLEPVASYHPDPAVANAMFEVMRKTVLLQEAGIWAEVVRDRRSFCLELDPQRLPPQFSASQVEFLRGRGVRHMLLLPAVARGEVLGGLSLLRFEGDRAFGEADLRLARELTERAALAIDNSRLAEAERRAAARRPVEVVRARLAAIVEDSDDAIIGRTLEGLITDWNRGAERMFGYTAGEIVGQPIGLLFPPSRPNEERQLTERLARGERIRHFETVRRRKDGTELDVSVTLSPIYDERGALVGVSKIARDITEIKGTQREILRARDEAAAANKELESFSYSVAHDLRAPLRSIDGFSQALLEDCGESLDAEGRRHLQYVRQSAQLMARLIDDLLTLSRVTRSELRRAPLNLTALARAAAARLARAAPERQVDLVVEEGLEVEGDAHLVAIALDNLLGNAWKFTAKQPRARVEVGRTSAGGAPEFFVRDNGAGYDMAYADKLFGAFQRLHHAGEFEGTGIGLATVQRIVRRHGGAVRAEGQVGAGATFYFTLTPSEAPP